MWEKIKYIELAVNATGKSIDSAITINNLPGPNGLVQEYKMIGIMDKSVQVFSLIQANCRFLSFARQLQQSDDRFEVLFEIKTVDEKWHQASPLDKEFFACWATAISDPTQIQASKPSADTTSFPRLFGTSDVPGLECHQIWLYVNYYGFNYNIKKSGSDKDNGDDSAQSCSNSEHESEFALIQEALDKLDSGMSESGTSGTEQILTPYQSEGKSPLKLEDVYVDPYATTPLIEESKDPSVIDEEQENIEEEGFFLQKAFSNDGS
ncbi:hypothetical protein TWF281_001057 [Arthrobotrys megalospora]